MCHVKPAGFDGFVCPACFCSICTIKLTEFLLTEPPDFPVLELAEEMKEGRKEVGEGRLLGCRRHASFLFLGRLMS